MLAQILAHPIGFAASLTVILYYGGGLAQGRATLLHIVILVCACISMLYLLS